MGQSIGEGFGRKRSVEGERTASSLRMITNDDGRKVAGAREGQEMLPRSEASRQPSLRCIFTSQNKRLLRLLPLRYPCRRRVVRCNATIVGLVAGLEVS